MPVADEDWILTTGGHFSGDIGHRRACLDLDGLRKSLPVGVVSQFGLVVFLSRLPPIRIGGSLLI
ncbi:hypothetical protein [Bradyrhizobium lablabi]|uniref:hypothetical protein n=1 Tax=Bradyrhizobium lablabi TaxID=722472 RepID=UPI001BAD8750|nr:hypothetical protein [Bradyrhizobium lablabi]MBR0697555.1 hypothetical protein [Bradyrhizobium lablabi]